jgi:hypothetical protein
MEVRKMSHTRFFLILVTGLLVGAILAPIAASAGPETDSSSGIAAVKVGRRCKLVNPGIDVTADTKVTATVVSNVSGVSVQRVVRRANVDKLRICLTKAATVRTKVAWIAHNSDGLADAAHTHTDIHFTKDEVTALISDLAKAQAFVLADSTEGDVDLNDVSQTIVSVQLTAPVGGQVTIVAAANVDHIGLLGADVDCDINTAASGRGMELWFERDQASNSGNVAGTRVFDLAAGATETYRLQCRESGDGGILDQATLTAIFTPAP